LAYRPRPLSDLVPGLTKDVFGRKNLLFGKMAAGWAEIAGADVAAKAVPVDLKLSRKTQQDKSPQAVLHLAVTGAAALELSYQKSLLIERLNMFFGYPAIKDIKFIQDSEVMGRKLPCSPKKRLLTLQQEQHIERLLAPVQENELQTALKNLGKAIAARQD
jgi:hypothetical protein